MYTYCTVNTNLLFKTTLSVLLLFGVLVIASSLSHEGLLLLDERVFADLNNSVTCDILATVPYKIFLN